MTSIVRPLLVALLLALAACGSDAKPSLTVRVVTGLVPGPEFNRIETLVLEPNATGDLVLGRAESLAHFEMPFARGIRVAEFPGVSAGERLIVARAYTPQGDLLVEQLLRTQVSSDKTVTLFLDRACVAVECPSPGGSAALAACLAGQCVDPRCDPTDPSTREFCPNVTFCNTDTECSAPASCATARCAEGICVTEQIASGDGACDDGQWCNPAATTDPCAPVPDTTLASDAGVEGPVCGRICPLDGNTCATGYWECQDGGVPVCTPFVFAPAGTACGTDGECDGLGACVVPPAPDGGA